MKKVGMLAKMLLISVNLPRGDVISATYGERYCPFSSLSKSCPQTSNLLVLSNVVNKSVTILFFLLISKVPPLLFVVILYTINLHYLALFHAESLCSLNIHFFLKMFYLVLI